MTAALRAAGVAIAVAVFGLFAHDVSRWADPAAAEPVAAHPRPPVFVCWRAGHQPALGETLGMGRMQITDIELERRLALLEGRDRWMMLAELGGAICIIAEGINV